MRTAGLPFLVICALHCVAHHPLTFDKRIFTFDMECYTQPDCLETKARGAEVILLLGSLVSFFF